MANTIKIKRRTDASDNSALAALSVGELGVDLTDSNKLYVGSSSGNQLLNPSASTSYLPLAGGTLTGQLAITENSNSGEVSSKFSNTNTQTGAYQESQGWSGAGYWRLGVANENYSQSAWRKTTWLYSHGGSLVLGANNSDSVWLTNTSFYPSTSGHDLGTNAQRWQLYATSGDFSGNVTLNSRLTFSYNSHYFEAGTNSVAFKNSSGTSYLSVNNTGTTVSGNLTVGGDIKSKGDGNRVLVESDDYLVAALTRQGTSGSAADQGGLELYNAGVSKVALYANTTSYINNGANFGIGSTNPQDKLNIHDSSSSANLGLKITRGSQTHGLRLGVNDSHAFLWTDQSQDVAFANNNTARLTIKASTGYVQVHQRLGVGTASPAAKLHVNASQGWNSLFSDGTNGLLITTSSSSASLVGYDGGNYNDIQIRAGATSDTYLYLKSTGIGINTASPYAYDTTATKFEVSTGTTTVGEVEVARFRGGDDADTGAAIVRITNDNDRGLVLKGGRTGTAAFADIGVSSYDGSFTRGIRIDGAGRCGIGAANPTNTLEVKGPNTVAPFKIVNSSNSDRRFLQISSQSNYPRLTLYNSSEVSTVHLDTNGNSYFTGGSVGIGTVSPSTKLDIQGGSGAYGLVLGPQADSTTFSGRLYFEGSTATNAILRYGSYLAFTTGATKGSASGTVRMAVMDDGDVGIGVTAPIAKLQVLVDSSDGSASAHGVHFGTANSGLNIGANDSGDYAWIQTKNNDDLVINPYGARVGIGTTSPARSLHVQGTTSIVHIESSTANANASVWLKSNVGGTVANRWEIGTNISRGASLEIFDRLNSVSRLELTNGGNLGLGTGSSGPSAKLHIKDANPVIKLEDSDPDGVYGLLDAAGGDFIIAADGGAGSANSFISFRLDGTAASAEKARITSTGLTVNGGSVVNSANSEVDIQLPDEGGIAMGAAYTYANVYGKSGDLHLRANSYPANTGSTSKIYLSTSTNSGGQASHVIVDGGRLGIGETSPWSALHVKSYSYTFGSSAHYNATIASSNTYTNGYAGGILFAGAYNSSETQTTIAGVWASRPNAGNGMYGGMVHIGGRQHGTANMPKVLNVNHEAVGIGTVSPAAKLDIYHNGGFTNDVPTARIYHRNLPDSGNNRVAALDVNVGMNNGDLFHHGHVQLFQHFTGGAYNSPRLYFSSNSYNSSTNHRQWWGIQALADTTATGDRLAFTCDLSSTNPTATPVHIMSLLTNGRVGIGVTAPSAKLHVNGGSKFLGGGDWTNIERVTTTESYYSLFVTSTGTNANQAIARFSHSATAGSAGSGTETAVIARDKSYFYSKVGIGGATFNQTLTITNPSTGHWDRGLGFRLGSTDTAKIIVDSAGLKFRTFVGGDDFYFRNSANTTTFLITDAGNIGINKTPAGYGDTKLEVNGNVSGTRFLSGGTITNGTHAFEAYGSSFESSSIRLKETGAGENEDPGILFQKGNAASTGDHCGGIYFQGTSDLNYAIIRGTCAGSSKGQLNIHIGGQQNTITRTSNDTPVFQLGEGGLALGGTPNDVYKFLVHGMSRFDDSMYFAGVGQITWGSMGGGTGFALRGESGRALSLGAGGSFDHIIIKTDGDVDIAQNININGATHAGETWDGAIHLKNSSSIGNETSNEAVIYAEGGELKCMDDDRNRTTLSSHIDGKWVYMSNNSKTGKSVKIHMEDLVKAVEEHLGVSFSEIVEGAE